MESKKIMDRLICGDVGYGKTEIALRAAFKAVQEEKQVVYLVPTTILAQQIYNTFVQRMKDFPVRVDMMSRFRTPGEMKKTVEGLKKGYVDIIVGTHRVLSKDVQFKNLGLLIVDEEQRFGVTHKEKIKQMKQNVDVLTLTACPNASFILKIHQMFFKILYFRSQVQYQFISLVPDATYRIGCPFRDIIMYTVSKATVFFLFAEQCLQETFPINALYFISTDKFH